MAKPQYKSTSRFNINFMRYGVLAVTLSLLSFIATIYFVAERGLNFGIDFTGGIVVELHTNTELTVADMRNALHTDETLGDVAITNIGSPKDFMLRLGATDTSSQNATAKVETVKNILNAQFPQAAIEYRKVDVVGPQVGNELIKGSVLAVGLALLAIMVYVWVRFEWQFGLCAILTLFHDAILTIGLYAFTQIEFNLTSVAAVLTIIGYSINDTVVVYDRVREVMRKYKKMPLKDVLNISVNETMSRTILTVGTTLISVIALVFFGGEVVRGFSLAMLFGITCGTFSSVYVSSYMLLWFKLRPEEETAAVPAIAKK